MQRPEFSLRNILFVGLGVLVVVLLSFSGKMIENVDNADIVIIQSAFTGKINIYTTPGPVA